MTKLLKPMIILLFVLSIAALALGSQLFSKREVLKGRVTKLQKSAQTVAANIKHSGFGVAQLQDYAMMDGQLRPLEKAAANQYDELQTTVQDLDTTRGELASTQGTLEQAQADLSTVQEVVSQLEDEGRVQKSDLAQKARSIDSLEQAQSDLADQVENLNRGLRASQAQLTDREREYDDLLRDYKKVVQSIDGGTASIDLDPSISGHVVVVRPEWNFVVVDLGSSAGMQEQVQLLIHRDRELVGRLRITEVQETMSIGEIMNAWEVLPVASGDAVIPPES